MDKKTIAILVTIGFSVFGVIGDYFLKLASEKEASLKTAQFYLGFVIYASTAFGWVYVMKHLKLAQVGVLYCVSMVLLLAAVATRLSPTAVGLDVVAAPVSASIAEEIVEFAREAAAGASRPLPPAPLPTAAPPPPAGGAPGRRAPAGRFSRHRGRRPGAPLRPAGRGAEGPPP